MKSWDDGRDKRVEQWRSFTEKKEKIEKKKKTHFGIKAPQVRMQERPPEGGIPKYDSTKPMGINDDYKKSWR